MSFLLKKTDMIYFYLNNDTKDNSQQNKFNTMDIIQNEWHKLVLQRPPYMLDLNIKFLYRITCIVLNLVKFHSKFYLYQFDDVCVNHLKKYY
tara:strand:- start:902 stop:1177 length:276 start_codon:yes stop_codon:yes gene_type:complete